MILLNQLSEKIDALSLRERCMVLLGVLFVLYFAWSSLLMQPLQKEQTRIKNDIRQKNNDVLVATAELQQILQQDNMDPNAENKLRLAELKRTMSVIEGKLQQVTAHMVAPENMPKVLETVLNNTSGLRLLQLKGLGSSPLLASEETQEEEAAIQSEQIEQVDVEPASVNTAFKHGFKLSFSGDYFTTIRYLEKLEKLDWKFYWDRIEYEVGGYPTAISTVSVYTVSLNPNWIGI